MSLVIKFVTCNVMFTCQLKSLVLCLICGLLVDVLFLNENPLKAPGVTCGSGEPEGRGAVFSLNLFLFPSLSEVDPSWPSLYSSFSSSSSSSEAIIS